MINWNADDADRADFRGFFSNNYKTQKIRENPPNQRHPRSNLS
jgi:hypothetical protein